MFSSSGRGKNSLMVDFSGAVGIKNKGDSFIKWCLLEVTWVVPSNMISLDRSKGWVLGKQMGGALNSDCWKWHQGRDLREQAGFEVEKDYLMQIEEWDGKKTHPTKNWKITGTQEVGWCRSQSRKPAAINMLELWINLGGPRNPWEVFEQRNDMIRVVF